MGSVFKQSGIIVLPSIIAYLALLALSFILNPQSPDGLLDPVKARDTFLKSPPAYLTYGSTAVTRGEKSVIFLGPSNVSLGFRPDDLQARFPDITFHNMSLGGTSIDGMAAMTDLVRAMRPDQNFRNIVFVAGLWYGEFLHSENQRQRTPTAQQMTRFGLFERRVDGYRRVVPPVLFDVLVEALRPYFLVRSLASRNGPIFGTDEGALLKARSEQKLVCDMSTRTAFTKMNAEAFEIHGDNQFRALVGLVSEIRTHGGKLVLADLPHPRCMTEVDRMWQRYQVLKLPFLEMAKDNGALYWNFQNLDEDRLFIDGTHPNRDGTEAHEIRFATLLTENMNYLFGKRE